MRGLLALLIMLVVIPTFAMKTYGPVKRGDSLWKIAVKNRPSRSVSLPQMVAAIEKLNPAVFKGHGAAYLKVGATLMLPTTAVEVRNALRPKETAAAAVNQLQQAASVVAPVRKATAKTVTLTNTQLQTTTVPLTVSRGGATTSVPKPTQATNTSVSAQSSSQNAGVPWSWLWFILFVVGAAYFFWYRRYHKQVSASIGKGLAAARLGVLHRRRQPVVNRYKTRKFKDHKSVSNHFQAVNKMPFSHSSADALATASIQMAEQEYSSAEQKLIGAISKDKKNVELRMKLLELYVRTNNRIAFKRESDALEHFVSDDSLAWSNVKSMYLNQWAYDQ